MPRAAASSAKEVVEKVKNRVLEDKFAKAYATLNDAQRRAVDTIEGPVMVVAGPGTGKTQTVSLRVANILRRTQMRPSNVLCLTFSVSGATAMRERMRGIIGADAYGVTIATIHAFAQSVIADHPQVFEDWSVREQITDIDRYRELNAIIDSLSGASALINPKDPYGKDTDLLGRISQVKREGKTLADLEAVAAEYDATMAAKSKPTTKAHQENLLKARKFRAFVEIFRRYQEMLDRTGRYDYDDMILHVIRALREHDWLLAGLQERFQYVLVDEVQDLNGAQFALLTLLTTYAGTKDEPNLFLVGDDDQSIYRFQGANVQQMLGFRERFPKAPVIALTVSYRSVQPILDAARSLIERNEERLVGKVPGLEKVLVAASKIPGDAPELLRAPSDTAEPWLIADLVEERIRKGMAPEDIAVLARKNAELFPLFEVFRARNIPVLLRGKSDLLTHHLVTQVLKILVCAEHPAHDAKLAAALACSCFGIHPADLGRLQSAARDRKAKLIDVVLSVGDDALPLLDSSKVIEVRDRLLSFHQQVPLRTVLETVEAVIRESGLLPCERNPVQDVDPRDSAAVEAFFSFVRGRSLERPSYEFRDFLSDLRFYADPTYGQVRLTYELPHLTSTGVWLLTAHQSKGLEFETVILANFRDGHWDDSQSRSSVSVPEELLYGWEKETKIRERHEDERRLAFVAVTRAKKELVLSCPKEVTVGEKTRTISPSAFFAEMGSLPERDAALLEPEAASLLLRPKPASLDGAMRAYLKERLESFALSATSLNRFLRDPQEFLRVDLLQQPEHLDESSIRRLGYGSAAHWALREWATALQRGEEFGEEKFLEAFAWYLRERTILTEGQRTDLFALGKDALPRYYGQCLRDAKPLFHAIERDYYMRLAHPKDPDGKGIPLKGKIDRIDVQSPTSAVATVIDYKTGEAKYESAIRGGLEPGSVSRTEDGANFRQLAFYAVLLEKADPLLKPESFALEFLGERGKECVRRSFVVTEAEKESLRSLIRDVWAKITALDFTAL